MNNQIQIFSNTQFGEIRTLADEASEPLFCLADLCAALGISNHRNVKARLDEDDVRLMDTIDNLGRTQQVIFVTESGMYDVIIRSDAEKVKPFRKWLTSEVIPSIRKTGGYIVAKADDTPEMIMARAVLVAQATIDKQSKQISEQTAKIEADAPKVLFADAVVGSKSTCLIGELAKIISQNGYPIGQNRLFQWLRDNEYLGKHGERYNIPNQQYVEMGLFELKKGVRSGNDGVIKVTMTTKVTQKGCMYFINKFLVNK